MKKKKSFYSIIKNHKKQIEQLKSKTKGEKTSDKSLKEHDYFHLLLDITRSISTLQDFNKSLELIVDSAVSLSNAERGFLMLHRKDGNLEFRVTRNIDKKTLEGEEFKISRTVVNQVLANGKPLYLNDIYKDNKFKISESIEVLGLHMVMCVPLKVKGHLLGLIYVDSHSKSGGFTKLKENLFEAFAAQASVAIENNRLYDSSMHDELTGLYNHGYLRVHLEEEIARASTYKKGSISCIMLDLDKFKSINDSYGYLFGNSILVKVAGIIKETVRKYDISARYGGNGFTILMPDADTQDAKYLAKRLQKEVSKLRFPVGKESISLTSSIGISTFPVEEIIDNENIIVEADHALFVAKNKGGNQIVVFGLRKDEKKRGSELIGKSVALNEVRKMISKLAETDAIILITGETGTGKELVANLVHRKSLRADKPLVVVNCGAIPDNLLESELFGYEKGAFTGAYRQHIGKFESAEGGTIFLDEIGELPLHLQVKILRAIEQREIDRIGARSPIRVDIRVISASNRDLEEEVKRGNFRNDLFYRLSVATIHLPPLRDMPEDIEELSEYYLNRMNRKYRRKFIGFTKSAKEAMMNHTWPGNIRELIHRIERAVIMGTGQYIDENNLNLTSPIYKKLRTLRESRDEVEKEAIIQTLIYNRWNITHTSKMLAITRKTLRSLIKKHNIVKHD